MKNHLITTYLFLIFTSAKSQTLQEIVAKTDNENFSAAAIDFKALINKAPNKGENYFYFGENFFKQDQIDSAQRYYSLGSELNATYPLNYIGLGKVLLHKGNVSEAKTQFYIAVSLSKGKNAEAFRKNAEAWLVTNPKNPDEALKLANDAIKIEPKNPENYILLGDAQLEKTPDNGSLSIISYKKATTLNPKNAKGILREGKLYYRGRNYSLAVDKYKESLAIDSSFAPAYREIAELYALVAQPQKSIYYWKKYFKLNNSNEAHYRYMNALYSNKDYAQAIIEYENLKKINFENLYLERLAGYCYAEIGDKIDKEAYTKGLLAINKFFDNSASTGLNFKYLASDFKYKGLLLLRMGKDSLAVIEMDKAILIDPSLSGELNSELATNALKVKKYDKAIFYFDRKLNSEAKNLNTNDYFNLGKAYFYSGIANQKECSELKEKLIKTKKSINTPLINDKNAAAIAFFIKADSSFSQLTLLSPNWPIGFFWRARSNSYQDQKNEKWLAKPYYQKVLDLVTPQERLTTYKSNVIEASEYLGDYYVNNKENKNKAQADVIWLALKELDPANEKVKFYFSQKK